MPRGDGTGPNGIGPMTGRAAGYCAGYSVPGFANPAGGRGLGFGGGRGFGRGLGLGFRGGRGRAWGGGYAPFATSAPAYHGPAAPAYGAAPTAAQEADALKVQAEYFETQLDGIKKRIAEIEDENKND